MNLKSNKLLLLALLISFLLLHCNAQNTTETDSLKPELDLLMMVNVVDIFQDSKGTIWLGTVNDGLGKYQDNSFTFYELKDGLAGKTVQDITEDSNGNLWLATDGGVSVFDGSSFTNYNSESGLASDDVKCITINSDGVIWIGTDAGINRFIKDKFYTFQIPQLASQSEIDKTVYSITEDSQGNMWFGSETGAWKFNPKALANGETPFSNYSEKDGLSDSTIRDILEDSNGDFWFSTQSGGVCQLKEGKFTKMTTPIGDLEATGWSLYEDKAGTVYFPVNGQHTYYYDGKEAKDFLPESCYSHTMTCVLETKDGSLFLGGWSGLFKLK